MNWVRRVFLQGVAVLFSVFMAATVGGQERGATSAAALLKDINEHGVYEVVGRLSRLIEKPVSKGEFPQVERSTEWVYILKQIETGDAQWLNVARALRRGMDVGSHSMMELETAVSSALLTAPANVLRIAGAEFSIQAVCTPPLFELEEAKAEVVIAALRRFEIALSKVSDPELENKRQSCLMHIKESKKRVAERSNK